METKSEEQQLDAIIAESLKIITLQQQLITTYLDSYLETKALRLQLLKDKMECDEAMIQFCKTSIQILKQMALPGAQAQACRMEIMLSEVTQKLALSKKDILLA